jgi:purine-nucleoside phosphorylase
MSVVPETIAARQMGIQLLGICNVANKACGTSKSKISHEEVITQGKLSENKLKLLINKIVERIK